MWNMTALEPDDLAKIAYIRYGDVLGWTNFLGDPMPEWQELAARQQQGWMEAAVAVAAAVRSANDA